LPKDLRCPDCGSELILKYSKYGKFWGCLKWSETKCEGSVGAHPDGRPLGVPASKRVRELRKQVHKAFDRKWKNGEMSRKEAYGWMRRSMRMSEDEAHIANFDEDKCNQLFNGHTRFCQFQSGF